MAAYNNLRAEMARQGITQAEIAECLGISVRTVNNWLTGKGHPRTSEAFHVRNRLFPDLTVDYLFALDS